MLAQQSETSWTGALTIMVLVGLLMVGSGWLVIWTARKAASGEFGRNNGWAGVRTRATNASDEAWLVAQQAAEQPTVKGGKLSIVTGILPMIAGLTLGGDPDGAMFVWAIGFGLGTILVLIFVVNGARLGHAAARDMATGLSEPHRPF